MPKIIDAKPLDDTLLQSASLESLQGIQGYISGKQPGFAAMESSGPIGKQYISAENIRQMSGGIHQANGRWQLGQGFASQGFDVQANQALVEERAKGTQLRQMGAPPMTAQRRAALDVKKASAIAGRVERDKRIQDIKDQKQLERLNRLDPKRREEARIRVDRNRAERGLGPIGGPVDTGQFVDVASFANLDPKFHAVGQAVRDSQGNKGIVQEQFGQIYVHPLTMDPNTGQLRPAPTSEEQLELDRETEEHGLKMADLKSRTDQRRFKDFENTLSPKEFGEWKVLRFEVTRLEDSVVSLEEEMQKYEAAAPYDESEKIDPKEDVDPTGQPYRKNSDGHLKVARDLHKSRQDLRVANENQRRYRQENSDALERQQDEQVERDMSSTTEQPIQQPAPQQVETPADIAIRQQEEFDAYYESLPPGATYVDPEGNRRTKK